MPRYIVERNFPTGLRVPINAQGEQAMAGVVRTNATKGVFWVHSYVSKDLGKTFCVYDGPDPESIRQVAGMNDMPVGAITPVSVLDPYFYHS
jgi:Protein of unknown function (DUF4242)